ncbi:hypothetical protein JCM10213v2_006401 [Rhodosporidiobolus nylandii]
MDTLQAFVVSAEAKAKADGVGYALLAVAIVWWAWIGAKLFNRTDEAYWRADYRNVLLHLFLLPVFLVTYTASFHHTQTSPWWARELLPIATGWLAIVVVQVLVGWLVFKMEPVVRPKLVEWYEKKQGGKKVGEEKEGVREERPEGEGEGPAGKVKLG